MYIQIFKNSDFGEVRVLEKNGDPWFILTDICRILEIKNSRDVKNRLKNDGVDTTDIIDALGRKQQATFINESNLYKLIFQSRKPEAEKFTDWVTSEVLPTIRQKGVYATDELLDNPDFLIKALQELKVEREKRSKLEIQNKMQTQIIGELKPKSDYTDRILKSKSLVTITQIAKDYGMSGTEMNKLLHELKVQYKQSGQWLLYEKYQNKGYTHSATIEIKQKNTDMVLTKMNTKWTQKGRLFLYDILKKNGYLPTIEQGD